MSEEPFPKKGSADWKRRKSWLPGVLVAPAAYACALKEEFIFFYYYFIFLRVGTVPSEGESKEITTFRQ